MDTTRTRSSHLRQGLAVLLSRHHASSPRLQRVCLACGHANHGSNLYFCSEACSRAFAEDVARDL
ncbi:MAG: hypothetical protein EP330_22365 [Deltaproteobacteria bacterium]|nr:MAG: hypothetical protein EP330_22365 [Deltaproteobacteria bacterium]